MQFQVDHSANFYCVIKSIESLLLTLKSVHITDNVSCYISGEGIILTVEHSRSVKAVAYILRGSFQTFRIRDDVVMPIFGLSINSLIDSITAVMPLSFGPYESKPVENIIKLGDESDYCEMTYDGAGSLLGLRRSIKETNQFVQCTIVPFEREEESEELKFDETQDPVQLIVIPVNTKLLTLIVLTKFWYNARQNGLKMPWKT
ncbi:uncharacterized protein EV154DRAFT_428893 [Mucor mucedo]|uniref:uncharacterized protein n=1 Tax=Mucor mucedo TaxID=29922 RepID=UPI00221EC765|nr:uncharacterized protein EV154DRAFT_428893 [Mucor mucedo]KAI7880491.1 hypothetical protein EV154DRAFT_428893 [Mucor mucedo]